MRLHRLDSVVHGIAAQAREEIATNVVCASAALVPGPQFSRPRRCEVCLPLVATGRASEIICREPVVEQIWTARPPSADPLQLALTGPAPKIPVVLGRRGRRHRRRGVDTL